MSVCIVLCNSNLQLYLRTCSQSPVHMCSNNCWSRCHFGAHQCWYAWCNCNAYTASGSLYVERKCALTPIDAYWHHYDLWPFIWPLQAVKWPSTSFSHRFGLYLGLHQKVTRFSRGAAANKQQWGVIKRGDAPLLNAGVRRGQHPLTASRFFEVGRRPETSLVDSWQPTPPEETQIICWCSMCHTLRVIFLSSDSRKNCQEDWAYLHFWHPLPRPHETHEYH